MNHNFILFYLHFAIWLPHSCHIQAGHQICRFAFIRPMFILFYCLGFAIWLPHSFPTSRLNTRSADPDSFCHSSLYWSTALTVSIRIHPEPSNFIICCSTADPHTCVTSGYLPIWIVPEPSNFILFYCLGFAIRVPPLFCHIQLITRSANLDSS